MSTWILLRGLARESRHWGGFGDALQARLAAGDRVLALDLPGTGQRFRERSPASVPGLLHALREAPALQRAAPPYVLVALSLGGMVARQWAAEDPLVRGCALINTSLGGLAPFWRRLRPASWPALLSVMALRMPALDQELTVLRLTSNGPRPESVAAAWAALAQSAPMTRTNVARQLLAAVRCRAVAAPKVPTLLLASTHDRLVSVACSRRIARAWRLPLLEHPWAGHDLPLDDPDWVITELLQWSVTLA